MGPTVNDFDLFFGGDVYIMLTFIKIVNIFGRIILLVHLLAGQKVAGHLEVVVGFEFAQT